MKNLLVFVPVLATLVTPYMMREFPQLPNDMSYLPDLLLVALGGVVVLRLVLTRSWSHIPVRYCLVFIAFSYVAIAGAVLNSVSGDTVIAGIRTYFRYLPLFLLPFAFRYTERDVRLQLLFVGVVLLVQVPVTIWQRFFEFASLVTGDETRGTMGTTSAIAMLASSAVVVLGAYFLRRKIGISVFVVSSVVLLVPAAIGETKVTPILLVIGGGCLFIVARRYIDAKKLLGLGFGTAVLLGGFIGAFNQLYSGSGMGFVEKMTSREYILDNYNLKGINANAMNIGDEGTNALIGVAEELKAEPVRVGRFDSIYLPFDALFPHELSHLLFGLGIGNVSSDFGSGGEYKRVNIELGASQTTMSLLLWETGVFGTVFFSLFLLLVFFDSYRLGIGQSEFAPFGTGFFAVAAIFVVCLLYANLFHVKEVTTLYFYFAGVVVAVKRYASISRGVAMKQSSAETNRPMPFAAPSRSLAFWKDAYQSNQ